MGRSPSKRRLRDAAANWDVLRKPNIGLSRQPVDVDLDKLERDERLDRQWSRIRNPGLGRLGQCLSRGITTYTLTLTGPAGTITKQATVTVTGFSATIQITGTSGVNLRSLANAAGYNGSQAATITFEVGSGVTITGTAGAPNAGLAVDSGTWPTGYTINLTLTVKNGGILRGGGGKAGNGADWYDAAGNGGSGGDAIYCRLPMTVNVNSGGTVQGGGGGGGGGGEGYDTYYDGTVGGGGGGGGFPNGALGNAGQRRNTTGPRALVARRREAEQVARPGPLTVITPAGALMAETLARPALAVATLEATEAPTRMVAVAARRATRSARTETPSRSTTAEPSRARRARCGLQWECLPCILDPSS